MQYAIRYLEKKLDPMYQYLVNMHTKLKSDICLFKTAGHMMNVIYKVFSVILGILVSKYNLSI